MSLWITLNFCKLFRFGKSLPSNMAALWAWKPADLFLYAVPVFGNHYQVWSHPKQAETGVSGYALDWKRAVWACFCQNDHFHAQNLIYKFGHWFVVVSFPVMLYNDVCKREKQQSALYDFLPGKRFNIAINQWFCQVKV